MPEGRDRRIDRRTRLAAIGASGAAGLAGCLGSIGVGSGTFSYGVLSPVSGAYKGLGPGQRAGAKLAIEELKNDDSFDFDVEAVYRDTGTESSTATQEATKAVESDGANYLMGAISSSVAGALNSFAEDNGVVYNPGGAAVPLTGSQCNEWVFRAETNTAQIAEAVADYTVKNLGTNVWFHVADYAYGDSVLNRTEARMKDISGDYKRVGESRTQLGASNFDTYIDQIGNSEADVVLLGMTGGDLIRFVKQAVGKGLKDEVTIVAPTITFQVVRGALKEAAYGTYGGVRYVHTLDTGTNTSFADAYVAENDAPPDNFARVGYQSVMMTAEGAREAGSADPADVKDVLGGLDMETIFGTNRFRKCDHQAMNPTWMGQVVEPDSGAVGRVKLEKKLSGRDALTHLPCAETGCEKN
jgi:branched-chain amino acid transport system substrate-binding protein